MIRSRTSTAELPTAEELELEAQVAHRVGNRLRDFVVEDDGQGLTLHGTASSYHVKQLVQHEVMNLTDRRIVANRILVLV